MRAGHRGPGLGDPAGQPGHQRRILPGGAQHGQVRGGPLVQRDQLVDLVAGQPAAPADQLVEPGPIGLVCGYERVNVHCRAAY